MCIPVDEMAQRRPIQPVCATSRLPNADRGRGGVVVRSFLVLAIVILPTLAALVPSRSATAQGTRGVFPEPISTAALGELVDRRVRPRRDQWPALLDALDDYQAEFRTLRTGEMRDAMERLDAFEDRMPTRAAMEDLLRRMDRIHSRVRELDDRFFDRVANALDDSQLAALHRVRQARERQRVRTSLTAWFGTPTTDLTKVLDRMALTDEAIASIDPILIDYEAALTRAMATLRPRANAALLAMVEAIELIVETEFAGMTEVELAEDREVNERLRASMGAIESRSAAATREAVGEIAALNHRTRRRIAATLDRETADLFTCIFGGVAYGVDSPGGAASRVVAALGDDARTDEATRHLLRAHVDADTQLVEELFRAIDRQRRSFGRVGPFDDETREILAAQLAEVETIERRRESLRDEFFAALSATVGDARVARAIAAEDESVDGHAVADPQHLQPEFGERRAIETILLRRPLRDPIGDDDIAHWSRTLELSEGENAVLLALHADHVQAWKERIEPTLVEIERLRQAPGTLDTAELIDRRRGEIDQLAAKLEAGMAAIDALDSRFMRRVVDAIGDDRRADRLRLMALERRLSIEPTENDHRDLEPLLNLVTIVWRQTVAGEATPPETIETVTRALLDRGEELALATRRAIEARHLRDTLSALWVVESSSAELDPRGVNAALVPLRHRIQAAHRASTAADHARRDLQRAVLDRLRDELLPDAAATIVVRHRRAADPTGYDGPTSPLPPIERALTLPDLADSQREAIARLLGATTLQHHEVLERLREIHELMLRRLDGEVDNVDMNALNTETGLRQFDQREIAARAVRRLRLMLTDEQATQIPGLLDFERRNAPPTWDE